jgi:hypothetical protein
MRICKGHLFDSVFLGVVLEFAVHNPPRLDFICSTMQRKPKRIASLIAQHSRSTDICTASNPRRCSSVSSPAEYCTAGIFSAPDSTHTDTQEYICGGTRALLTTVHARTPLPTPYTQCQCVTYRYSLTWNPQSISVAHGRIHPVA